MLLSIPQTLSHFPASKKGTPIKLSSYRDYLQSRYRAQTLKSTSQWPPVPAKKIIKLAMIQKEKYKEEN